MKLISVFILIIFCSFEVVAQSLTAGFPILEESLRRSQVLGENGSRYSFSLRPAQNNLYEVFQNRDSISGIFEIGLMPVTSITRFNSNRPYGWGDFGMIPSNGFQQYISAGFYGKLGFIYFQIQPEFVSAQNPVYRGFPNSSLNSIKIDRFRFWNLGDNPERFGDGYYKKLFWGQSSLTFRFKSIDIGASTRNIWWGPGQWNSLIFSNNAQGFPHLTIHSHKPVQTFLGDFEFQLLVGRLEDSGFQPTQFDDLNSSYFRQFNGDWRYLNALMFSYAPKWIPNLSFGFSRTFQRYSRNNFNTFRDYFPVFEGLQKENFIENGNAVEYDSDGYDQQFSVFSRYYNKKAKTEVYFEYGRRDHSLNQRELILNPEHARAYLLGFKKLFNFINSDRLIQLRGEIVQQGESINRFLRYGILGGGSWHTHQQARGFSNLGQSLGVGTCISCNTQTLEISMVEKFNKMGILLERLENHQDFFYRAFGQQKEHQPWIDLSVGFLFDKQWNNLLLSSKLQLINGINYQWQLAPDSTPEYPKGENLFSFHSQVSLIYLFDKGK